MRWCCCGGGAVAAPRPARAAGCGRQSRRRNDEATRITPKAMITSGHDRPRSTLRIDLMPGQHAADEDQEQAEEEAWTALAASLQPLGSLLPALRASLPALLAPLRPPVTRPTARCSGLGWCRTGCRSCARSWSVGPGRSSGARSARLTARWRRSRGAWRRCVGRREPNGSPAWGPRRLRRPFGRFDGDDEDHDQVGPEGQRAGEEDRQEPDDSDDDGIDIEVGRHPAAHSGEDAVIGRTVESSRIHLQPPAGWSFREPRLVFTVRFALCAAVA